MHRLCALPRSVGANTAWSRGEDDRLWVSQRKLISSKFWKSTCSHLFTYHLRQSLLNQLQPKVDPGRLIVTHLPGRRTDQQRSKSTRISATVSKSSKTGTPSLFLPRNSATRPTFMPSPRLKQTFSKYFGNGLLTNRKLP